MPAPLVEVRSISKTFTRKAKAAGGSVTHKALDAVSFSMTTPERIALIGPSGSGKSTLLRSISGLHTIDRGEGMVTVLGSTVQANGRLSSDVRAIRSRMGMIAQQFNLVGRLTLFTNVALGFLGKISGLRSLMGLWTSQEKQTVMRALNHVGVAAMAGQRANTLSGGQQQRGAIARAIVQGAEIVLADEPVASLDPVTARKVMKLLVDLNERDKVGVIVTLHQVDYAKTYCNRILALKDGKIVYDGPAAGLSDDILKDIYGAEIEDAYWGEPHA
ncbi:MULTISPECIES: phosphonate ABC transporter ATP-binding protein [Asticcacaulis]|uniref:phosphonate ABC transporter ATP-binding protein n=1 Tax=Asticcacaulis TaxID=76890 RepID=UPI001AE68981|nr:MULTISPECIES: phosphonate ABC transporter ATP-binding protein [Asticcacaulis]MBP2159750.1 phosphonate transport system ATP-binding protein [Asticcacaulis solisilvae]MDR6800795.1 phosphonate transport system ATP-binding protein [Asticcacaulis sp. BE141]